MVYTLVTCTQNKVRNNSITPESSLLLLPIQPPSLPLPLSKNSFFLLNCFIYLFIFGYVGSSLHAFFSCKKQGLLSCYSARASRCNDFFWLLIVVASLVAECGLQGAGS